MRKVTSCKYHCLKPFLLFIMKTKLWWKEENNEWSGHWRDRNRVKLQKWKSPIQEDWRWNVSHKQKNNFVALHASLFSECHKRSRCQFSFACANCTSWPFRYKLYCIHGKVQPSILWAPFGDVLQLNVLLTILVATVTLYFAPYQRYSTIHEPRNNI